MYKLLQDLTWVEAKEAFKTAKLVIIPIGSTEQHGPHLPLINDAATAFEFAKMAADKAKAEIIIAPPVVVGVSEHHMPFPGTLTLSPQTLVALIMDICKSLKAHGIKRVAFVNGHGGNTPALTIALRQVKDVLQMKAALINYWELIPDVIKSTIQSDVWGHACEFETSIALVIYPDKVRKEALRKAEMKDVKLPYVKPGLELAVHVSLDWSDHTSTGSIGDPTLATKEKGEKMINAAVERMAIFLDGFAEF
ncbi:MAG: creatininase family protein [Candidatus Bathyarchaeia archaeon]